ncbi:MAG: DUF2764 family protein [bacterium]|nr:DUF2764 family protein [bacterium]
MSAYYYFVASLPGLRWGEPPPLPRTDFLQRAQEWLPPHDAATLAAAAARDPAVTAHPAGARWWQWETAFGNALASARAARLGRDATPHLRSTDVAEAHVRATVQEAVKLDDPLKAEQLLDQLRWQFYESLAAAHAFDFETVLSYLLRLGLLERWAQFDPQRGHAFFSHQLAALQPADSLSRRSTPV